MEAKIDLKTKFSFSIHFMHSSVAFLSDSLAMYEQAVMSSLLCSHLVTKAHFNLINIK